MATMSQDDYIDYLDRCAHRQLSLSGQIGYFAFKAGMLEDGTAERDMISCLAGYIWDTAETEPLDSPPNQCKG